MPLCCRSVLVCLTVFLGAAVPTASAFVNFESPQSHPIDLSPDGATLAVCNTAANLLELFSVESDTPVAIGSVPVGYDPVSVRFRNNSEAWVVNHVSDSVSIVNISTKSVVATLQTKDEPCDLVFAGDPVQAFVSCSQANTIQRFDPANLNAAPVNIPIVAEEPRAMAVSPDGSTVYVAIFESNNLTTIIGGGSEGPGTISFPPNSAMTDSENPYGGVNPPPNDPDDVDSNSNLFIPAIDAANGTPPRVGLIVRKNSGGEWRDDNGRDWTRWITGDKASLSGRYTGWDMVDRDVAVLTDLNETTPTVSYVGSLMNICMGIAVNPASGDITVIGTEAINQIRFEPVIKGIFVRVMLAFVTDSKTSTDLVDLNAEHLAAAQPGGSDPYETPTLLQTERDKSIGDPRGIVWNSEGTLGYITGMGSNNLVVVDDNGDRLATGATTEVREGPTGIVLDESREQLYVLNRFDASISVVDSNTLLETTNVSFFDPTPADVTTGRKHLYDTHKNSGLGQIACASCHIDGRMDRLSWDLGDPAGTVKALSGSGITPQHNLGANIPGLTGGFTAFHPMKGPMSTQTLQDIIGKEPHHWRGDRDGIEEFNGAFIGLQGDDQQLTTTEMQEFEDFLASLHFPANPFRNLDNSLPDDLPLTGQFSDGQFAGQGGLAAGQQLPNGDAVHGLELYRDFSLRIDSGAFTCIICHTLPTGQGTDSRFNGATFDAIGSGPNGERHQALVSVDGSTQHAFKTPQLRNQYDKAGFEMTPGNLSLAGFGLLHDGSVDSISRFVSEQAFIVASDQEVADLTALVMSFSGGFDVTLTSVEPPGVFSKDAHAATGKQITLNSSAKNAFVDQILGFADNAKVDVIVKGTWFGFPRGWRYTGSSNFESDWSSESGWSKTALLALAKPGQELTFTVVPFGESTRLGIDRNLDTVKDFDELLATDDSGPSIVLSSSDPNPSNNPISVTAKANEPLAGFTQEDIALTNCSISNFNGEGDTFTFTLTPIVDGAFSAIVQSSKCTDLAGNANAQSNTLNRTKGPAGTLKVKKPNSNVTIAKGTKYTIKWNSTGDTGPNVRIELWRNGSFVRNLKSSTPNDGKQKWTVQNNLVIGGGYKIRVVSLADGSIEDMSNKSFTIVKAPK